ncbi:hypothetical protein [Azospirillum brasilense]|uniref:Uncharacterized protein n=1 Tax=Azospirillum brasilense TaxID=192 RepID=A0A6L3AZZ3_AZOBR|nr:hypothetical protein [Azospirillum brasilense]KAA0684984.1 hypothetical protein DS837_16060 [Azospirillum brasilense]
MNRGDVAILAVAILAAAILAAAILVIVAAEAVELRAGRTPDADGCPFGDRRHAAGRVDARTTVLVESVEAGDLRWGQVAAEFGEAFGEDLPRMHRHLNRLRLVF